MQRVAGVAGLRVARAHCRCAPRRAARPLRSAPAVRRGCASPGARPGPTEPASPRRPARGARPARRESRAACGCLRRRWRAPAASWAAPASHGGLHTTSGARPGGNRSACTTSTRSCKPRRVRFSRAQASARGSRSVATTRSTPRRARIAAITPVPVPMSKASSLRGQRRGGHQIQVLAAHRREHAVVRMDAVARAARPAPASPRPSCATRARPPGPAVHATRPRTAAPSAGPQASVQASRRSGARGSAIA